MYTNNREWLCPAEAYPTPLMEPPAPVNFVSPSQAKVRRTTEGIFSGRIDTGPK